MRARNARSGDRRRTSPGCRPGFARPRRLGLERLESRTLLDGVPLLSDGSPLEADFSPEAADPLPADSVATFVELQLTPATPQTNTLDISVTVEVSGFNLSDSDTATVTGNVLATVGVEFDPATAAVTDVDELTLNGGIVYLSDVAFNMSVIFVGGINITGTDISGTLDTPNPPGTVTDGAFNTAEHVLILDNGQFHASGTGLIGQQFAPVTINLADEPMEATGDMTGHVDVSLLTVVDDAATYRAVLTLPVDFQDQMTTDDGVVVNVSTQGTLEAAGLFTRTLPEIRAEIAGRHVFYNHSAFDGNDASANANDDNAIATDKTALLPGGRAGFVNYTSYARGINGIMVDLTDPADLDGLSIDSLGEYFTFRTGNDSDPSGWTPAPPPVAVTVREGAGTGGSDRVTFVWEDYAICDRWLQVTALADTVGLAENDVFYLGNAVAEAGNSDADTQVTTVDLLLARNNPRSFLDPAAIDFAYDFDRDGRVNVTDVLLAREHQTTFVSLLQRIEPPGGVPLAAASPAEGVDFDAPVSPAEMPWLEVCDPANTGNRSCQMQTARSQAADKLLESYLLEGALRRQLL
ncbi:MAG TPA: hypothetical protein VMY42_05405 [Thermoguttaceae bacterium]|nr:hypothetical protein [Thermoguttaceae bacterium]